MHSVGGDFGLLQINGHLLAVDDGNVVALVIDVAEGQLDVPNIAAVLKSWAHPFPVPDDWMGTNDTLF